MGKPHNYTEEQKQFLRDNIDKYSYQELTAAFNAKFGLNFSRDRISSTLGRLGLRNGRKTCFVKGHIPSNKGKKGIHLSPKTEFKKGNMPPTYRPVGSERIDKAGYHWVKTADPKTWRMKHVLLWEQTLGVVPKGHVIIFADKNKNNITIENLILVSRAELARMNQNSLIYENTELTKVGHEIAKLVTAVGTLTRKPIKEEQTK
jgi:hypothetical protein